MNKFRKWPLTTLERREQPLAAFAVEVWTAMAQLRDRLVEIVALACERVAPFLDLAQFVLGPQVDGAQPLAVHFQRGQPRSVSSASGSFSPGVRPASSETPSGRLQIVG